MGKVVRAVCGMGLFRLCVIERVQFQCNRTGGIYVDFDFLGLGIASDVLGQAKQMIAEPFLLFLCSRHIFPPGITTPLVADPTASLRPRQRPQPESICLRSCPCPFLLEYLTLRPLFTNCYDVQRTSLQNLNRAKLLELPLRPSYPIHQTTNGSRTTSTWMKQRRMKRKNVVKRR